MSDITYVALGSSFVYLAVVMDVFTRSIRGWHLSRGLDADLTLTALRQAFRANAPAIHHSDQGVPYAAKEYVSPLQSRGVAVSMAAVGCPEENGFAGRLMRTIKEEHVSLSEYRDLADARAQIGQFPTDVYQTCTRRVPEGAHPLGAGLSHSRRVRGGLQNDTGSRAGGRIRNVKNLSRKTSGVQGH